MKKKDGDVLKKIVYMVKMQIHVIIYKRVLTTQEMLCSYIT